MPRKAKPQARAANSDAAKSDLDDELDQALEQTFPASDPVSVGQSTGTEPPTKPVDRKPRLIDSDLVDRLARKVSEPKSGAK